MVLYSRCVLFLVISSKISFLLILSFTSNYLIKWNIYSGSSYFLSFLFRTKSPSEYPDTILISQVLFSTFRPFYWALYWWECTTVFSTQHYRLSATRNGVKEEEGLKLTITQKRKVKPGLLHPRQWCKLKEMVSVTLRIFVLYEGINITFQAVCMHYITIRNFVNWSLGICFGYVILYKVSSLLLKDCC